VTKANLQFALGHAGAQAGDSMGVAQCHEFSVGGALLNDTSALLDCRTAVALFHLRSHNVGAPCLSFDSAEEGRRWGVCPISCIVLVVVLVLVVKNTGEIEDED
jgi:hypothetical protein